MENEKPFKCSKCSQCFATSDHLLVHQRVHINKGKDNQDLVVKIPASSTDQASDKTPTPTRFVKIADVDGSSLFEEINPFEHDFKLASKRPLPVQSNRLANSSPVSSTSYNERNSLHEGKNSRLFRGVPVKISKPTENEGEVSSTVFLEGSSTSKYSNDKSDRGRLYKSNDDQEISSSTSEENVEYELYSLSSKKSIHGKKQEQNKDINRLIDQRSSMISATSSTSVCERVSSKSTDNLLPPNSSMVDIPISTDVHSWTKGTKISTCNASNQLPSVLSTSESKEQQSSLQTFLQQIQKEIKSPKSDTEPSTETQSQEALREKLKSLIKSGQIKIKFTPDPSSPKVQATIVGNIAKKTPVTARSSTPEMGTSAEPLITQSIATSRPTMVKEIQPQVTKNEECKEEKKLCSSTNTDIETNLDKKDIGQITEVQSSSAQPLKLLSSSLQKLPTAIQFVPKFPISRPIPIAPKKPQPDSSCSPIAISQRPLLPVTGATITSSVHAVQSPSSLGFAKQKLKHIIQANSSNKTDSDSILNERATMVTSVNLPTKYKNINFLGTSEGINSSDDPIMSSSVTLSSLPISSDNSIFEQTNKRKFKCDDIHGDEKRKKFLERNRAAASRCRQKRKVWVNQLETRSDNLSKTNSLLLNEINALRSEVVQLKSLLLAHKDCPVTRQQKALLGQMTPGSYIAAVSDGQIIALHQIPDSGMQEVKSAEEVASSALTDMAMRLPIELDNNGNASASNIITTSVTVEATPNTDHIKIPAVDNNLSPCDNVGISITTEDGGAIPVAPSTPLITSDTSLVA